MTKRKKNPSTALHISEVQEERQTTRIKVCTHLDGFPDGQSPQEVAEAMGLPFTMVCNVLRRLCDDGEIVKQHVKAEIIDGKKRKAGVRYWALRHGMDDITVFGPPPCSVFAWADQFPNGLGVCDERV